MQALRTLRLAPGAFGNEPAACLGAQIVAVIEAVASVRPGLQWYLADIETSGFQFPFDRQPEPVLVGDAESLTAMARKVNQFESGVIAGVPADVLQPEFRDGGLWTDDDEFADLRDAVVEVRAFDTSYVSVTSPEDALIAAVQHRFKLPRAESGRP